jgi:hypothetical protein
MAIRGDSYSSVDEVVAYTKHLLSGSPTFDSSTRPTKVEVEKFIDRASGILNGVILGAGFAPATITANSTAKLALDDWTTNRAAMYAELTGRGAGWSESELTRTGTFKSLADDAAEYIEMLAPGWKMAGLTVADPSHQGLTFTALDKHSERDDPDSTSLEQPKIRRGMFDHG